MTTYPPPEPEPTPVEQLARSLRWAKQHRQEVVKLDVEVAMALYQQLVEVALLDRLARPRAAPPDVET